MSRSKHMEQTRNRQLRAKPYVRRRYAQRNTFLNEEI